MCDLVGGTEREEAGKREKKTKVAEVGGEVVSEVVAQLTGGEGTLNKVFTSNGFLVELLQRQQQQVTLSSLATAKALTTKQILYLSRERERHAVLDRLRMPRSWPAMDHGHVPPVFHTVALPPAAADWPVGEADRELQLQQTSHLAPSTSSPVVS